MKGGRGSTPATGRLELRRWTRDEYRRMAAAGILGEDDAVELLEGAIVETPPITPAARRMCYVA